MQDSKRLELIGKGLAWENVTKAKTNSAGHALLEIAPRVEAMESELARMRDRIECLRGGLKSAAGWLLDAGDIAGHEKCLEMAGDMEPPIMGSNDRVEGRDAASSRRVPSHDGLCGNGSKFGAGGTAVDIAQAPDIHAELTMAAFHREVGK